MEVPRGAIARLNDQLQYWRMLKPMMKLEDDFEYEFGQAGATDSALVVVQVEVPGRPGMERRHCARGHAGWRVERAQEKERRRGSRLSANARLLDQRAVAAPYAAAPPPPPPPRVASGEARIVHLRDGGRHAGARRRSSRSSRRRSESYQRKIAVHVRTCGLDDADLIRWAWTKLDQADAEPRGPFGWETLPRPGREASPGRVRVQYVLARG